MVDDKIEKYLNEGKRKVKWNRSKDKSVESKDGRFIIVPVGDVRRNRSKTPQPLHYKVFDKKTDESEERLPTMKDAKDWAEKQIEKER